MEGTRECTRRAQGGRERGREEAGGGREGTGRESAREGSWGEGVVLLWLKPLVFSDC
jgi:hypothetical protein